MDRQQGYPGGRRNQHLLGLAAIAALTGSFTIVSMTPANAAATTRYVATVGDDTENDCTNAANPCLTITHAANEANPGDTVSIAAGTYPESVVILQSLTIIGAGSSLTTISGNDVDGGQSIQVNGASSANPVAVALNNVGVSGNATDDGVDVQAASVDITDSRINDNAGSGVRLDGSGTVGVANSTIDGNGNSGIVTNAPPPALRPATSAVVASNTVTVTSSDISNNGASGIALGLGSAHVTGSTVNANGNAGIVADSADPTPTEVDRSILDSNVAAGVVVESASSGVITKSTISATKPSPTGTDPFGGGVADLGGASLQIADSTISGNTNFGVLDFGTEVPLEIDHSTITGTRPSDPASQFTGGLVYSAPAPAIAAAAATGVTATATITAANDVPDCSGTITDGGYNLESDGSCHWSATGSVFAPNPHLGPLADNGGPTPTVLPGYSSLARNAIPFGNAGCVAGAKDQRGKPRPDAVTHRCDIGSVEAQVVNPRLTATLSATHHRRHGWYRGTVSVHFHCVAGSAPLLAGCPVPVKTHKSGRHHVTRTIHAFDGGKASVSRRFKIDNTRPRIRVFLKRGTAHAKCRDSFSGVASCDVQSQRVESGIKYVATARDRAGNVRHKRGKLAI